MMPPGPWCCAADRRTAPRLTHGKHHKNPIKSNPITTILLCIDSQRHATAPTLHLPFETITGSRTARAKVSRPTSEVAAVEISLCSELIIIKFPLH